MGVKFVISPEGKNIEWRGEVCLDVKEMKLHEMEEGA
jgi:hypothetical protein